MKATEVLGYLNDEVSRFLFGSHAADESADAIIVSAQRPQSAC